MSEWRAKDLVALHELFEEYDLVSILSRDSILQDLHAIRDKIDSKMRGQACGGRPGGRVI